MKIKYLSIAIALVVSSAACSQSADRSHPDERADDEQSASNDADMMPLERLLDIERSLAKRAAHSLGTDIRPTRQMTPMDGHLQESDALVWKHDWEYTHSEGVIFGGSLAAAGDVNGDDFDDFIVGTGPYIEEEDVIPDGTAFVFHGGAGDLGATHDWSQQSPQEQAWFGYVVAAAGDVNGDDIDDIIVGAPKFQQGPEDDPTEDVGAFYVYHGSANGLSTTADFAFEISGEEGAELGRSVSSAGDIDGDGYDDVIVGAPYANGSGGALIFRGGPDGLDDLPEWGLEAPSERSAFGWSVAGVGDVNGDGYSDVVVGAPVHSNGESGEGGIFLYLGGEAGPSETPDWQAESDVAEGLLGYDVSTAGDVNGDGFDDLIAGAIGFTGEYDYEGAVFAYLSDGQTFEADHHWMITGERQEGFLGRSVSGGGDVNGDDFDDVLIADAHFGLVSYGGMLYRGGADGLETQLAWEALFEGNSTIGDTAALAGDLDADGRSEVLLGAPHLSQIYLYYGAACFDADWDGFTGIHSISCPDGTDCHDLADWANPEAPEEWCDGLDTNCDGEFDEGCDDDSDDYCDNQMPAWLQHGNPDSCPNGPGDCDDEDPDHNPGSPELCNFRDDNCNGNADEAPLVCGEEQLCHQGGCFDPCEQDADCDGGKSCYGGRCAASACENVECPERTEECFKGTCQVTCQVQSQCEYNDLECIDGRCALDPCDGVLCPTEQECQAGECVDPGEHNADAGDAGDAGDAAVQVDPQESNSNDGGCSTTPGGGAPVGVLAWLAVVGGLVWRRRK